MEDFVRQAVVIGPFMVTICTYCVTHGLKVRERILHSLISNPSEEQDGVELRDLRS